MPTWSEEQGAFLGHVAEAKFDLLTDHTTDADLVVASRQLSVALMAARHLLTRRDNILSA